MQNALRLLPIYGPVLQARTPFVVEPALRTASHPLVLSPAVLGFGGAARARGSRSGAMA